MEEFTRTSRWVALKDYNIDGKGDHFLEVTEWHNGEGFDLHISRDHQWLSLTWEEFAALQKALGDWIDPPESKCPHIITTDEGTPIKLSVSTAQRRCIPANAITIDQ